MDGARLIHPSRKQDMVRPSHISMSCGSRRRGHFAAPLSPAALLPDTCELGDTANCRYKTPRWNQKEKAGRSSLMAIGYFNQTLVYHNLETAELYQAVFTPIKTGSETIKKFWNSYLVFIFNMEMSSTALLDASPTDPRWWLSLLLDSLVISIRYMHYGLAVRSCRRRTSKNTWKAYHGVPSPKQPLHSAEPSKS